MKSRILVALPAAAILIAGMYVAAARGLADAHYTKARLTLAEGTPANASPRAEVLASAQDSMRQALELEPIRRDVGEIVRRNFL